MHWLISSLIFVGLYTIYKILNIVTFRSISDRVFSYFSWLNLQTQLGVVLFFLIVGIPLYLLLTFCCRLYLEAIESHDESVDWLDYFKITTDGKKQSWPLLIIFILGLILASSIYYVILDRFNVVHWLLGAVLWWGMLANYFLAPVYRIKKLPPKVIESTLPEIYRTLTAKELVSELRKSRFYRGQIVWHKDFEYAPDDFASDFPKLIKENTFLIKTLKSLGIAKLYKHQEQIYSCISERKNAILATPIGSGRSTIINLIIIYKVLVESNNVLFISPTKLLAEKALKQFSSFLEKTQWEWSVKFNKFVESDEIFEPKEEIPEVLFTIPDVLHHTMLPNHKKFDVFFNSLGLVVLNDLQFYKGIYGTNCAFLFRRLKRICKIYEQSPQIIGTIISLPLTQLQNFVNNLTGEKFDENSLITTDHKGLFEKSVVFWQPPLERINKGPDLKRINYFEEAKNLLVEILLRDFETLLLSKEVLLCESDIREADDDILKRLREKTIPGPKDEVETILEFIDLQIKDIYIWLDKFYGDIENLFKEAKANSVNIAAWKQMKEGISETIKKIKGSLDIFNQSVESPFKKGDLSKVLLLTRQAKEEEGELLKALIGDISGKKAILIHEAAIQLKKIQEKVKVFFEKLVAMLKLLAKQKTPRWLDSFITHITDINFKPQWVDACLMSGFPGTEPMVMQELKHLAGGKPKVPSDWLLCIILALTPLNQYYKNNPEEYFVLKPEEQYLINLENTEVLKKHLLCILYEDELKEEDIERYFDPSVKKLLTENLPVKKEIRKEVKLTEAGIEEKNTNFYIYDGKEIPHKDTYLSTIEKSVYKIIYAPTYNQKVREVGVIDTNRIFEKAYKGAVLRINNNRYRVNDYNTEEEIILVRLENDPITTQKINKIEIEFESYKVINQSTNEEMGRLDKRSVGTKIFEGTIMTIGQNNYKVEKIEDQTKKIFCNYTTKKEKAFKVNLEISIHIERNPVFPIHCGKDRVKIKERILGYTWFDRFDMDQNDSVPFAEKIPDRDFYTNAVYIGFPAEQVDERVLHSVMHLLRALLPTIIANEEEDYEVMYTTCHPELQESAIFIYDNVSEALGIADALRLDPEETVVNKLLERSYKILIQCPCRNGCPACLHIFQCRQKPANENLDKKSTIEFLGRILSKTEEASQIIKNRYDKIDDDKEGTKLRDKIFEILKHNLGLVWKKPVTLVVSTEKVEQLEKEMGKSHHVAGIWTDDTLVIREGPEDYMVGLIAHEYTHDWEFREGNMSPKLLDANYIKIEALKNLDRAESIFAEGFAEWVAFRTLDFYGLKYEMERYGEYSPLPEVYKAGFEVLYYIEKNYGAQAVIDFIKTGEGFDFEELYMKSGVKDLINQITEKLKKKKNHQQNDS